MKKSYKKLRKTRKNVKKSSKKMGKRKTIKKYSKLQIVKASPTGFSYSNSALVYKPGFGTKVARILAPMSVFDNIGSFGFVSQVNQQGIADGPFPIFEGSAITTLATSGLRRLDATGSASTRPTLQTGQKNFQILLESCRQELTLTNAGSSNVEITIYNLVSKVSKPYVAGSPATDWQYGIDDERSGIPNTFPAAHDAFTYYAEPTQVKRFNQNWTVLKKVIVTLGVGRVHKHVFDFKPQRIVDTSYAAQYNVIRGITCSQIITTRGQPADNRNEKPVGDIGSTATKVLMINRLRYYHRVTTPQPKIYEVNDTLLTDGALYVKEEDGDTINANTAANYA